MNNAESMKNNRELIFDYFRSVLMLVVFYFHFYKSFPGNTDYMVFLNPFAELFVGLAGFMVGLVYLHRQNDRHLLKRGFKILIAFYIVALPEAVVKVYAAEPSVAAIQDTLIKVTLMLEDPTAVNILRFYGLIFIMLPLILRFYRKNPTSTMVTSVCIFLISTLIYRISGHPAVQSFFVTQTLLLLLQWQVFLVIGLRIGELYKSKKIHLNKIRKLPLAVAGVLALVIQFLWFRTDITKFPYTFGKMFGIIYLAPLVIFASVYLYSKIKDGRMDAFIRVVGRNSLAAFVLSEVIRIALIKIPVGLFPIPYTEFTSSLYALGLSVALIWLMWGYEKIKHARKDTKDKSFRIRSLQRTFMGYNFFIKNSKGR